MTRTHARSASRAAAGTEQQFGHRYAGGRAVRAIAVHRLVPQVEIDDVDEILLRREAAVVVDECRDDQLRAADGRHVRRDRDSA